MKKIFLIFFLSFPIVVLLFITLYNPKMPQKPGEAAVNNIESRNPKEIVDEIAKDIEKGELETAFSKMVEGLKHPDIPTSQGQPLIVLAAEKNNLDMVSYLIDLGCEVNALDIYTGETALIKAARNGNFEMVNKLISVNANMNVKSQRGITALTEAIKSNNGSIAEFLLSRGAYAGVSDENLLSYAFDKNYLGMDIMLRGGANANFADVNGNTPLIVVSSQGNLAAMQSLTAYKANVNAANKNGMTPLLYAIKGGYTDAARLLLSRYDTDINKANKKGQTPLFYAAYYGNTTIAQDLLELGADYNKADVNGVTPLVAAKSKGHAKTARAISDFIAFKNLPRDEQGKIVVNEKKQSLAPSEKTIASKQAQQNTLTDRDRILKQAQEEKEKALAQAKAMQNQIAKNLNFTSPEEDVQTKDNTSQNQK